MLQSGQNMRINKILNSILHPFLFGIFFVLFLYAHNADEVLFTDTISSFITVFVSILIIVALFSIIYRDWRRAALVTSLLVVLFFSYGHVFELRGTNYWTRHRYLLGAYTLIFLTGAVMAWRSRRDNRVLTRALNIIALLLILSPLTTLAQFQYRVWRVAKNAGEIKNIPKIVSPRKEPPPDIYYIMTDAYAAPESLKEFYNFDNSEFVDYLRGRGFYIVPKSISNHSGTMLSLTTTLNIDHLENLSPSGEITLEALRPRELVQDNLVGRFLKSQGYTYIQMGSFWEGTFHNPYADVNINTGVLPQFPMLLYSTTAVHPYTFNFGVFDDDKIQWTRVRMQFDDLKNIPDDYDSPVFVFAHIGIPRGPFVFNEDGSFQRPEPEINEPERAEAGLKGEYFVRGYIKQVQYANLEIKNIVDALLEKSDRPPIIIVQSDHGSRISIKRRSETENVDDLYVRDRMRNFSAILLPSGGEEDLYNTITPINSFRVIFDRYFGTNLGLVPDRAALALPREGNEDEEDDKGEHYNLLDVTERARHDY